MFQQKATRAATKMENVGMLDGQGDLFALMQSVVQKKSENTTYLRDQEIFKSFVSESDKETRALPTDLFTDKNKGKNKSRELKVENASIAQNNVLASDAIVKETSPPPEPKLPDSIPNQSPESISKMMSWGGVSPVSLKEEGTEPVFKARKSPPPEERLNLQRPKLSDLFSHSQPSQKVKAPPNKNKSKSKEEEQRIEKLKEKFLRKGKRDKADRNPAIPPTLKL